jgi:hypothetical protein
MKIIVQDTSVSKFGVNDIQQARAIRKICGWFGIVDTIGANIFSKLF